MGKCKQTVKRFRVNRTRNKNETRQSLAEDAKTFAKSQRYLKKEGNLLCLLGRKQEISDPIEKHLRVLLLQDLQIVSILHIPKGTLQVFLP
jgi:hypothetical protein